jgi:hypothetical protein
MTLSVFEVYEKADRITVWSDDEAQRKGLTGALFDITHAAAEGISWLTPETEVERDIYRQVLDFHQEWEHDDAIRRMHLVLSAIEPVSKADWCQYLDTLAFFRAVEADDNEAMTVAMRMHGVIMGRLATAPPAKQAAAA